MEQINIKLEEEDKKALKEIAEKQNRSMNGQIRHWIEQKKKVLTE